MSLARFWSVFGISGGGGRFETPPRYATGCNEHPTGIKRKRNGIPVLVTSSTFRLESKMNGVVFFCNCNEVRMFEFIYYTKNLFPVVDILSAQYKKVASFLSVFFLYTLC